VALNLLRRLGTAYIPDARRRVAALSDFGLHFPWEDY